jgi:alpha-L-rhamnosidase
MTDRNKCNILINGVSGGMIFDDPRPVFTFQRNLSEEYDAWQLSVYDSEGTLMWRSEVLPATQVHSRYAGQPLKAKSQYKVNLAVLRKGLNIHSKEVCLETGFLGLPWSAKWIEPEQEPGIPEKEIPVFRHFVPNPDFFGGHARLRPCQEIKKDFILDEMPKRTAVYVSAHGVYEFLVNGKRLTGNVLSPETSCYPKQLYYQKYDILPCLKKGKNTFHITLADGWWIGRIGMSGDSCQYGDRLGLILQAELIMSDGTIQTIASDESFLCRPSFIDYADLFIGERRDFTKTNQDWQALCKIARFPTDNLTAQKTQALAYHQTFDPVYFYTPDGDLMADFGQCLAGVVEVKVQAQKGTKVTLDFCEVLDQRGNFLRNILGRNKDQRDVFVCSSGTTHFYPRFTYHGFRFVRIQGVEKEQITCLKAHAIGTPIQPRGEFFCSDQRLNRLQANICRSMLSNMFSVPTDCPQREKAGWTGDLLTFAPTGCFNFDLSGFIAAWLSNMRDEQFADGAIPVVVPNYPHQEKFQQQMNRDSTSSAWSDACIFVPWYLYRAYGDIRILEDNLAMMKRWLDYVAKRCQERPQHFARLPKAQQDWNDYLWTKGFHFGDWFIPSLIKEGAGIQKISRLTREVVGSSFYAYSVQTFIRILDALIQGNSNRSDLIALKTQYEGLLGLIKEAVRTCFISTDGRIRNDLQGLYVIVLQAGIVEGELKRKVAARLAQLIRENGDRLDTGFVSVPYLLPVLSENGYHDLAVKLLFQTQSPSWLYMVEKGATTIWENWEAIRPDGTVTTSSFNHYALGSVGHWIYRYIGGIRPGLPGYRHTIFAPDIHCGLESAACHVDSYYGRVSCRWYWQGGECTILLDIPPHCTGEFDGRQLSSGHYEFSR